MAPLPPETLDEGRYNLGCYRQTVGQFTTVKEFRWAAVGEPRIHLFEEARNVCEDDGGSSAPKGSLEITVAALVRAAVSPG